MIDHLGGIRRSFDFPMLMVNLSSRKGTPTLVTWHSQAWRYFSGVEQIIPRNHNINFEGVEKH